MTSAAAQIPSASMATATRPSRFPNYTMPAAPREEKSPNSIAPFGGGSLQNIWTPAYTGSRDISGSRGSSGAAWRSVSTEESGHAERAASDDSFSNPSATTFPPNADDIPWGTKVWNAPDPTSQPRQTSGSSSPNRKRDGLAYFENQASGFGAGFRGGFGRPKSYREEDKENVAFGGVTNGYDMDVGVRPDKRAPQNTDFHLGVVGSGPSRDPSMPPSRGGDGSPAHFSEQYSFPLSHTPNSSIQSSRPSLNQSLSFPIMQPHTQNSAAYDFKPRQPLPEEAALVSQLKKSMTLDEAPGVHPAAVSSSAFPNPDSQPFQPTPGSHAWLGDPTLPSRFPSDVGAEPYLGHLYPQLLPSKRSPGDRISPTSQYMLANSPKRYTPPAEPWNSRPPSREPRTAADVDRRNPAAFTQAPAAFYVPTYFNPNFPNQFAPSMYDAYTSQNFRAAVPIPPYGLPVHSYLQSGRLRPGREPDSANDQLSSLLKEFRSCFKSNKRYELKDIYGHIVEFSGDQHGSRFIQGKLETANSDEKDQVFREIEPNAIQLMKDLFGNYVIQKFFEHGNQVQKKVLAAQMKGRVVDLSMQMYACRVVQKALEHVLVEQQSELVRELEADIIKIVRDQNGNHVVQKIIELVPRQYIGFIMDSFRGQVSTLAGHAYGCRVIQRMLEHGSPQDKDDILKELHDAANVLITDQYGNYVTQHVIQHGKPDDRSRMIHLVTSNILNLSKHKFASNVVEKCIEYGTSEERRAIRRQLSAPGLDGTSPLQLMMKDQYGNYVIQKMLSQLEGAERESFIEEMRPQFMALKRGGATRQLQALDKLMGLTTSPALSKASSLTQSSGPVTPALQVDINSSAPTPVLTMEPNSPQSSSPPSTNASAAGDVVDETTKTKVIHGDQACPAVMVQEM